jgi:hypothetical protein
LRKITVIGSKTALPLEEINIKPFRNYHGEVTPMKVTRESSNPCNRTKQLLTWLTWLITMKDELLSRN